MPLMTFPSYPPDNDQCPDAIYDRKGNGGVSFCWNSYSEEFVLMLLYSGWEGIPLLQWSNVSLETNLDQYSNWEKQDR